MKIAIFSDCYLDLTGGIVQVINAQKAELEQLGHTVYVFSTAYPKSEEVRKKLAKKRIFIVPSCRWYFRGLTPVGRRPKVIEKWLLREHPEIREFDVFYVHYEAGCSIAGLRLARKLEIRSVQVMHGREDGGEANIIPWGLRTIVATMLNWFHSWYLPHPLKIQRDDYLARSVAAAKMWTLMVNHANYADVVVTPSEHFKKKLIHYGVDKPVEVVPNGYPDEYFPVEVTARKLNEGEKLKMIWHSRVSGEKRIMPFLKALAMVEGPYQLDVYGGGGDLRRAERFVQKHRLPVIFHGNVKFEDLQKAIKGADLDVLVSYNFDTFGMTLIEAGAYGVPVFFCDPEMREIVPDGGYVLSAGPSAAEMAAGLNDLMAHPEQITKMSEVMIKHRKEVLASKRIKKLEKILMV